MFPAFVAEVEMFWEENEHEKAKYLHVSVYSNREHNFHLPLNSSKSFDT